MAITGTRSSADSEKKALQAFADLIGRTADGLRNVSVPAQLGATLDSVLPDWERTDRDFAQVLRDLKGQAWGMQPDHLRAIREKLVQHLETNLADVRRRLGTR